MLYTVALLVTAELTNPAALARSAIADRQQFAEADHPFITYIVADDTTAHVLFWILASTSTTAEIELCRPSLVSPGLWRLDIRNLGWRHEDWKAVLEDPDGSAVHPYGGYSMVVRGDWLVTDILDTQLSAAAHEDGIASYYRLLYQGKPPATESEFLKFWEIDGNVERHRGQIEGLSQVNRRGRRWIERRDRHGGYFWITRDSLALTTESDPLERPDGGFVHDGSEAIVGIEKLSSSTYERGAIQFYALFDGQGKLVNEAPVQLVEDGTRFRNVASIRTWGSCLKCHVEGIRPLEQNSLVDLANKYNTLTLSTDPNLLANIRRFHFGSLATDVSRNQQDYAAGVKMVTNGWNVEQLIEAVETVVRGYDAPLDLEKAARELGTTPALLKKSILAYAQLREGKPVYPIPSGIAVLVYGGECSRDLFAQQFGLLDGLVKGSGHASTTKRGVSKAVAGNREADPVPGSTAADQAVRPQPQVHSGPTRRRRIFR